MSLKMFSWQYEIFRESKAKFNIIPAGRRTGKTQGAERSAIIDCYNGLRVLWVDTIYSNIDRYFERYFAPDLEKNGIDYVWNAQKKILKIGAGYIDFRSADKPESIEGFGYNKIYLNEAGIILNNDYLYTNAILPMLMDYEDSQLYAFGTPKGKVNKKGEKHRFFALWEKVEAGENNFNGVQLSSYSNPILTEENIEELEKEIRDLDPDSVPQEIYGLFTDQGADKVFNAPDMNFADFTILDLKIAEGAIGAIDVADEGTDFFSFPLGYLIGKKFFVTEWLFTQQNTNYTINASAQIIRQNKLDYCIIETNNHGSVVYKEIENQIEGTELIGLHQKSNKHSRIIQNASFIKNYFVFREDYAVGSDYDKAMKQLFAYTKDGKGVPNDDAPDSLALLAACLRDLYESTWY